MRRYLRLYALFLKYSLMQMLENRFDFLFRVIPTTLSLVLTVFMVNFLYLQVNEVAGWNKDQMLLLLGTYNIVWGFFFGLFIHNMGEINKYINRGELDLFLTKPINSQFYVSVRNSVDFGEGSTFLFGLILLIYSLSKLGIQPSFLEVFLYIFLIMNAVVLAYALWFISITTSFWLGRIRELHEIFISFFNVTRYPLEIFRGFIKLLLVYFIPLAVLVAFPTRILLKTLDIKFIFWSFIITLFTLFFSNRFWNFGLKHYSSASS